MNLIIDDHNEAELSVADDNGISLGASDTINIAVKSYNRLEDKPQIEGVELVGNKSLSDIGAYSKSEVDAIVQGKADESELSAVAKSGKYDDLTDKPNLFSGNYNDLTNKPTIPTVPTKVSAFTNDVGYMTSYIETDPTVPQWAKAQNKPTYTASEVGALPSTIVIPSKTSDLDNDSNFTNKTYVDGTSGRVYYGQVDSTSTSTVFTATIDGITEYYDGLTIMLKNGVVTSASGFTININGLGAKHAYSNMAAATAETTMFNINYTMMFTYDSTRVEGGGWILYRGYNSNDNTIGYQIRSNSMSLPMTSVTYRYRLLFTSADRAHFVPANNSTSTNATAKRDTCQDKIDPFGRIVYYGTTASVASGSRPSVTALWDRYTIALGYSFNRTGAALTLTSWKPVYLKCAPQTDGSAIIDADEPYVQELPTTADGKIYIHLGVAYSATNIELNLEHPVYYHDGTIIRMWTGPTA